MNVYSRQFAWTVGAMLVVFATAIHLPQAGAQTTLNDAQRRADVDLSGPGDAAAAPPPVVAEPAAPAQADPVAEEPAPLVRFAAPEIDLISLASPEVSGLVMYPIYAFALIVLMFIVERSFALRRARAIPPELVRGLAELGASQQGFDLRRAYRCCQQYPSAAASTLRAALLKIGRPQTELELALAHAREREVSRLRLKVWPLRLAATATPLLGLCGTVYAIIKTFYAVAQTPPGDETAQALAAGIGTAFVATLAGLVVGITAVCFAHYFESKIQRFSGEIDDLASNVVPHLEGYEGKVRVSRQLLNGTPEGDDSSALANRMLQ